MGTFAPEEGEFVRIVLELKGRKGLTQKEYNDYKAKIKEIARRHGAKWAAGETVRIEKKPRKKKR